MPCKYRVLLRRVLFGWWLVPFVLLMGFVMDWFSCKKIDYEEIKELIGELW